MIFVTGYLSLSSISTKQWQNLLSGHIRERSFKHKRKDLRNVVLALRTEQKGLELICHILPDVPGSLVGDPGRLRQIIVNLVGNAIKFTEQGEIVLRVEKESQTENETALHFSITDTGVGIPADKQKLIFEAFSQVDGSTTRKYGGTGLGLAISMELVNMMGGRIWVESEEGKGSNFQFTIRLGLQKEPDTRLVPADLKTLCDLSVLIVDDNATNRHILMEMLTHWHMKPSAVDGGRAALAAMERADTSGTPFVLMLLDAQMPKMDGFVVSQQIRKNPRFAKIKIIMLSSIGRRGDAARCGKLEVDAYLPKPVKQSDLMDTIATVMGESLPDTAGSAQALVTRHTLRENRQHMHILLAEDNIVNQKVAARLIQKRGHTVVVANNGKEALAAMEKESFDLVLMDVQMPVMGGFEATAAIRQQEKETDQHIPIIAMTAHAMKGDREKCLKAGMDNYVSKPVQAKELFAIIEKPLV